MDHFLPRDGQLWAEDVPLAEIAEAVGTPVYVYSSATLLRHLALLTEALEGMWIEPEEYIDVSDELLVVPVTVGGRARHTGIPFEFSLVHVLDMRGGKVVRLRLFAHARRSMPRRRCHFIRASCGACAHGWGGGDGKSAQRFYRRSSNRDDMVMGCQHGQ